MTFAGWQVLVTSLINDIVAKVQAGAGLAEFGQLLMAFVRQASTALVNEVLAGPEKKAALVDAVMRLYDQVIPVLPLPWWLKWAPGVLRDPAKLLVSGIIEWVYQETVKPQV